MPRVVLSSDMCRLAGGIAEVDVSAGNFSQLVAELRERFPDLSEEIIRKQSLAIDGRVIHTPMLEAFRPDSELVFVARIAGG